MHKYVFFVQQPSGTKFTFTVEARTITEAMKKAPDEYYSCTEGQGFFDTDVYGVMGSQDTLKTIERKVRAVTRTWQEVAAPRLLA
jgi:hypothetical protein